MGQLTELKSLSPEILLHIAKSLSVPMKGLVATIELLDEGGSVPFIARYRKEATGNLDEVQIRAIEEQLLYFRELQDRKATILASIQEQGKLTTELQAPIEATLEKSELEDLYLPFKPKRRTKATIAREKGFDPLAQYLWAQQATGTPLETYAATFGDRDEALGGARQIVAEMSAEHDSIRRSMRKYKMEEGLRSSRKIADAPNEQEKFKMYYDYREPVKSIPSHRMLAIRRGETENVLHFTIELDPLRPSREIASKVHKQEGDWTPHLTLAIDDAWKRLLNASIQGETRLQLKQNADTEAIKVFRDNLQNVLLAPPAGQIAGMGINPGIRTGCKIAVVDETGKFLAHDVIYPHQPKNDAVGAGGEAPTPTPHTHRRGDG